MSVDMQCDCETDRERERETASERERDLPEYGINGSISYLKMIAQSKSRDWRKSPSIKSIDTVVSDLLLVEVNCWSRDTSRYTPTRTRLCVGASSRDRNAQQREKLSAVSATDFGV
jgi:hypothetical protein